MDEQQRREYQQSLVLLKIRSTNRAGNDEKVMRRLWERVEFDPSKPNECYIWTGSTQSNTGHGRIRFEGSFHSVRRVLWANVHGSIEANTEVHATCKNKKCVNPLHLYVVDSAFRVRMTRGMEEFVKKMHYCDRGIHPRQVGQDQCLQCVLEGRAKDIAPIIKSRADQLKDVSMLVGDGGNVTPPAGYVDATAPLDFTGVDD